MSAQFQFGAPGDSPMTGTTPGGLNYTNFAMPNPQYQPVQYMPGQYGQAQAPGLIGGQMNAAKPFPIYNPALAKYGYA